MNIASMPTRKPAQNVAMSLKRARSLVNHVTKRMTAHTMTTAMTYRLSGCWVMADIVPSLAEGCKQADYRNCSTPAPRCDGHGRPTFTS
jgi:hypothetical protein